MAIFSDLNSFFELDGKEAVVTDLIDIKYSLARLFNTPVGSVPFNRDYGSSLYSLLFESSATLDPVDIQVLLYKDIQKWEPRVSLNPLNLSIIKEDAHSYLVTCTFTVPSLNNMGASLSTRISE